MHSYTQQDSVGIISLDDGKANAVGHDFVDAMNDGLDRATSDAQAVVICGREGVFSGGFDLKEMAKGASEASALVNRGAHMLLRLFTHQQPVILAATGHAIAAGAFTCLAADTRFGASGDFKYGLNETALGMSLPVFGIQLASARLSRRHLTRAVTQATIYDSQQAVDVGFLDALHPADELLDRSIEEAARLGEYDTTAYHFNKIAWRKPYIDVIEASLA